jgi:hypothetical protein
MSSIVPRGAVPAGLGALGDENVGTRVKRLLRHVFGLHLADQAGADRLDARRERRGIAE